MYIRGHSATSIHKHPQSQAYLHPAHADSHVDSHAQSIHEHTQSHAYVHPTTHTESHVDSHTFSHIHSRTPAVRNILAPTTHKFTCRFAHSQPSVREHLHSQAYVEPQHIDTHVCSYTFNQIPSRAPTFTSVYRTRNTQIHMHIRTHSTRSIHEHPHSQTYPRQKHKGSHVDSHTFKKTVHEQQHPQADLQL
jgi:hypothetical protein